MARSKALAPQPPAPAPTRVEAIIEVCLCHHLRRTARAVTRRFDEALLPLGIKSNQFNILVAVGAYGPAVTGDIAQVLMMDRTTLSRNLGPLRRAGYLDTIAGAGRRPETMALSVSGRAILQEAGPLWQQAQRGLTRSLGATQAGNLLEMLNVVAAATD